MLAALAWAVDGKGAVGPDDAVMDGVTDLVPISDSRVHVEPFVLAVTLGLGLAVAGLSLRHLLRRAVRAVLFAGVATIGVVAVTELLKVVVSRRAIEGGGDESFPSGTATWTLGASVVCALLLESPRARRMGTLAAAVVALAIAVIIVWERWHYPSDVLGGWLLVVAWVGASWLVLGSERERRGRALRELPADRE